MLMPGRFRQNADGLVPGPASPSGQFLKDDGSWATPAGGGSSAPAPVQQIAGRWYWGAAVRTTTGNVNVSGNIRWFPVVFYQACTISNLGVRIITAAASGNLQLALYASSGGAPTGSALVSTPNISTTSAGLVSGAAAYSITTPGLYFIGVMVDATATNCALVTHDGAGAMIGAISGADTQANLSSGSTSLVTSYSTTGITFGTWPTNPALTITNNANYFLPNYQINTVP